MKISNSKKQLAKIIHENGGWRDGAKFSAQDKDGEALHYAAKPTIGAGREVWSHKGCMGEGEFTAEKLPNWHQTILSRDEYFYLYPATDAKPEFCESVMRSIPEPSDNPTIEQLAADYRNLLDFAQRKQEEADDAKADAEARLAELVAAGKALGLVLSVATPESELVITDWRDLKVGDIIEYVDGRNKNRVGMIGRVDRFDLYNADTDRPVRMASNDGQVGWPTKWRFIRRP